jgi:hypothetical protein
MMAFGRKPHDDSFLISTVHCVELNEMGIQSLQDFEYEIAIEKFGAALRMLNKLLSSDAFASQEQHHDIDQDMIVDDAIDQNETLISPDCDEEQHILAPLHSSAAQDTIPENDPLSQEDLFRHRSLIYKKPISTSHFVERLRISPPTYLAVVEISISVMFNFGLSHHLLSISGQSEVPEKVLDQAVALYELTHALQLQEGIELSLEYTMGIICNLGHIHQLRGDRDKSSKCFQHLLSIFCFLQSEYMIEQVQSSSTDSEADISPIAYAGGEPLSTSSNASLRNLLDTDEFFHSVSHLLLIDSAAAAA